MLNLNFTHQWQIKLQKYIGLLSFIQRVNLLYLTNLILFIKKCNILLNLYFKSMKIYSFLCCWV